MLVYWSFVLIPSLLSLTESIKRDRGLRNAVLAMLFVALFFFMALRDTGGDYPTYLNLYDLLAGQGIEASLSMVEPLYGLLNWISAELGLGLYGVNAACAAIFLYCLYRTASKEKLPLLLTTLAIPYFVIVVGMGYTRQGVAAALMLLGLVQLRENRYALTCLTILAATGFHYSAFAALAIPVFARTKDQVGVLWLLSRAALVAILLVSSQTLFSDQIDTYTSSYIESDRYESGGALLRSLVTAIAGIAFFSWRREFRRLYADYEIWRPFALLALLCPPLSLIASTPVDRLGLYLIPFQIIVFCRLPLIVNRGQAIVATKVAVLVAYVLYFSVWLHFGSYASELWVPYRWIFSS